VPISVPEGPGPASTAAREVVDSTGTRCPGDPGLGLAARTDSERTLVWDWRVITGRTDLAEGMQPLHGGFNPSGDPARSRGDVSRC
jgi:hypothetical protein